jgi:hypothetical protein
MTHVSGEIHTPDRIAVPHPEPKVPLGIQWLAFLSTNRWRPRPPIHPSVAEIAAGLEAEGWMIRGAWVRNYLLWRNGRTMREARLPLLVLPLSYGDLSALQIDVFLAVELIEARSRFRQAPDRAHPPVEADELQAVIDLVGADAGIVIADPLRLHRQVMRTLERSTR